MISKKDETVVVIKTTEELEKLDKEEFRYAAQRINRQWTEDFVDEDTGQIISMDRYELVFDKGYQFNDEDFSSLLFYFQTEDVKEAWLSNQQRCATLVGNRGFGLWVVKADGGKVKPKLMLRATNAMSAYECAKDYIELNYRGDFFIKSIKTYGESIVIEPLPDTDDKNIARCWYTVGILIDIEHDTDDIETFGPLTYVAYAETVESAKVIIENYIAKKRAESGAVEKYSVKMSSATTISADTIIPMEFCMAYKKGGDDEQD